MRSTYLAMMSASRLTGSPGRKAERFVTAQVFGMMATSKYSSVRPATVRLMPSTAIESPSRAPSATTRASTVIRTPSPHFSTERTRPNSSTMPVNINLTSKPDEEPEECAEERERKTQEQYPLRLGFE